MVEITSIKSPEGLREQLSEKLKRFMEENEPFNVQGGWETEGIEVSALIDFSIEDREKGKYYVGSISARFKDNRDKTKEELINSKAYREGENAIIKAIQSVFKVGRGFGLNCIPETSDIGVSTKFPIMFGVWETERRIDYKGNSD